MRPPFTAIDEYPTPTVSTCHSNLGPSSGHSLSRPVSRLMPSRFGPRHCGQSPGSEGTCAKAGKVASSSTTADNSGKRMAGSNLGENNRREQQAGFGPHVIVSDGPPGFKRLPCGLIFQHSVRHGGDVV